MRTVFLVVQNDSHFVELSRVAGLLKVSGNYKPIIWFLNPHVALARDLERCRSEGWEFIFSGSLQGGGDTSAPSSSKKLTSSLSRTLRERFSWFSFIEEFLHYRKRIRALARRMNSCIQQYQPDLMVVCEENVGYATHILIRTCQAHHIDTVIIPYTIANATEPAEYFYDSAEHQVSHSVLCRFVAKKYPQWVYEYRGRKLLRLSAPRILALQQSGYGPTRPWVLNSEETALIAVENKHMFEYYRNEKLPEDRLIVTGALYEDVLAESTQKSRERRDGLIAELGLHEELPILLCALPPSQFPRACEFADYKSLLSFWMESLSQVKQWNVVIRPHPRITEDEINVIREFRIPVTVRDTASLVPLCSLYLASVSATIRWAIACGIPVINYDVYCMKYDDYANVAGVLNVENRDAFLQTLDRITKDKDYYEKIAAAQKKEMSNWGTLDGKSGARILQLFDKVAAKKHQENLI